MVGALVAGLLVVAVIAVLLGQRTAAEQAAASALARDYHAPSVSASPAAPIVSVIGDGLSAGSTADSGTSAEWPALAQKQTGARVVVLAESGMGYVKGGGVDAATTFSDYATTVFPQSRVVLLVGGNADVGSNPAVLLAAARTAYATAKAQAPGSTVIAIGPVSSTSEAPVSLIDVRDQLRTAARREDITFVDPIGLGWLSDKGRDFARGGSVLTDAGQQELSTRISTLIDAAL